MANKQPLDLNKQAVGPSDGAQVDTSTGSAADVEAVMRKYDRESNTRIWEGTPKVVVSCILAAFSLFCIYVTLFANFLEQVRMTSFMGLVIVMGFLTYPAKKGNVRPNSLPWYDIVLMLLGACAFFFYTFKAHDILNMRLKELLTDPIYTTVAVVGILVLAELCRRSVGLPILCVAVFFIIYTFANGKTLSRTAYEMFYGDNGILGTPVSVCSKYIVVFIIFGAFLERTGVSNFFINLANAITGRFAGGPAKVAVISSALCGMVSGSSVGNTVTTGSMTIPMMKKTGYRAEFAGAVEAAASTGGQIMPPIMGAAAFLMADYLGVPYSNIIVRAILPAVLYFLGIFISVHLEAKKLGLKGIDPAMLPRIKSLIKDTYLLLPLIVLIWLVCSNTRTMQFSAAVSILVAILVGVISNIATYYRTAKEENRSADAAGACRAAVGMNGGFTVKSIFESLEAGGRSCVTVAVACGIAGVICGCITVTGLANRLISAIVSVSGNSMLLGLVLTMFCCIVLGMGVPTTATYCIMASTCAPILIQMGVPQIAAHFFVFYYGIVADITPPVALAAYAGAAIAKGKPMATGVTATRLAIGAFIIPFVFAYTPSILFIGDVAWYMMVLNVITAVLGMVGVAAGLSGYLFANMNILERMMMIGGGLCLIFPGILTDVIGIALLALVAVWQFARRGKAA
ncbi:MAG: TRAP transporter permease [Clostridiales bacterium]|nr:TRAP transporter permease [Clostridiales bacterium]